VSYGFDAAAGTVWLEALVPPGPGAGELCRRHADAMRVPKGWWLQDRRSEPALFAAEPVVEGPPPAPIYRPRRRKTVTDPLPIPAADEPAPVATPAWTPAFDVGDDLDGLLDAKTPLLSRAFRREGGTRTG
jgi:hypothetical protein